MLITLIIVSWVLSMLPAIDYICNNGKVFKVDSDREWLTATLFMSIPVINLLALATVLGHYFKENSL